MSELTVMEPETKGHDLAKLEPKKMELEALVGMCKGLVINGIDDKDTYKLVDDYRKKLVKARTGVIAIGDELKEEAKNWVKNVNKKVEELVGIVQPVEKKLVSDLAAIDLAKEIAARKEMIPTRREDLLKVGVEATDEFLMEMDSTKYNSYLKLCTENHLAAQAKKLAEAEAKVKAAEKAIQDKIDEEARLKKKHEDELAAAELQAKIDIQQAAEEAVKKEKAAELLRQAQEQAASKKPVPLPISISREEWLERLGYKDDGSWVLKEEEGTLKAYVLKGTLVLR